MQLNEPGFCFRDRTWLAPRVGVLCHFMIPGRSDVYHFFEVGGNRINAENVLIENAKL